MLKISALCLRSLERFCGGSRTAIRLRTGGRPSKGIAPLQRGILDLSNTGSRNWSGPDMKEAQSTIHDIVQAQVESINHVVPWFLTNMPAQYFLNVRDSLRTHHVKAIASMRDFKDTDMSMKMESFGESNSQREWSFIAMGSNATKVLERELKRIHWSPEGPVAPEMLSSVKVYSSNDKQICILVFTFTVSKLFDSGMYHIGDLSEPSAEDGRAMLAKLKEFHGTGEVAAVPRVSADSNVVFSEEEMSNYLSKCSTDYLAGISTELFLLQKDLYHRVVNTEITAVDIRPGVGGGSTVISVASTNTMPERLVLALVHYLLTLELEICALTVDCIEAPQDIPEHSTGYVVMSQVGITKTDMTAAEEESLCSYIKRLKWTDASIVDLALVRFPFLGLDRAEVITALCTLAHGALKPMNPHAFVSPNAVLEVLASDPQFMKVAATIADLFLSKFNTSQSVDEIRATTRPMFLDCQDALKFLEAASGIQENPLCKDAVVVLHQLLLTVGNISGSNVGVPSRYALSMIVSPGVIGDAAVVQKMDQSRADSVFVFGFNFSAFHCRFGKLARGGLAVWAPRQKETYAVEAGNHFKQTYEGAYAQNLVNKDVPAAGSKSIILLNPCADTEGGFESGSCSSTDREFVLARRSIRAFTDSLLDLEVVARGETASEFVFASPVDRVVPSDLVWLYKRLKERGFVNHVPAVPFRERDFEMNAESLVVFLVSALRQLKGLDPETETFTVKLMNRESELNSIMGPGHVLNVLLRDYPNTCKIVCIATGNCVVADAGGIDHVELLRLCATDLPMSAFDTTRFSPDGYMVDLSARDAAEGNLHKVLNIESDVYIPCSPHSHDVNVTDEGFLTGSGNVLSKLVIEGAADAASASVLESARESGIAVIKASSSLKGFAIAAEWEPLASLFHKHANKKSEIAWHRLDAAIVGKVRRASNAEADLLYREYKRWSGSLPELSDRIAKAINRLKGLIATDLVSVDPDFEKIGMRIFIADWGFSGVNAFTDDDCTEALPKPYRQALIASSLAAMFVYREGLEAVENVNGRRLVKVIHKYYMHYDRIHSMVDSFVGRDMSSSLLDDQKAYMLDLLDRCGPRAAMQLDAALCKDCLVDDDVTGADTQGSSKES